MDSRARFNARKRVFCLAGAFGQPNFGDEMILRAWLRKIAETAPGSIVYALGMQAQHVVSLQAGLPLELRPTGFLWQHARSRADRTNGHQPLSPGMLASDPKDSRSEILTRDLLLDMFAQVEFVHFVGGGYLNNMWQVPHFALATAAEMCGKLGKRLFITGQTIGPLDEGTLDRLAPLFRQAAVLDLRDDNCAATLQEHSCDVQVSADDVFLDAPVPFPSNPAERPSRCLICIQRQFVSNAEYDALLGEIRRLLEQIADAKPGLLVQVLEFSPADGDADAADALRAARGKLAVELVGYRDLWENFKSLFTGGDVVAIGTRFHFSLFCARAGIPVTPISLSPYYFRKHSGLSRTIGVRPAVPVAELDPEVEAAYLLAHWDRDVRQADLLAAAELKKRDLFDFIYGTNPTRKRGAGVTPSFSGGGDTVARKPPPRFRGVRRFVGAATT